MRCIALASLLLSLGYSSASAQTLIDDAAVTAAQDVEVWECNTLGGYVVAALRIGIDLQRRHVASTVPAASLCASAGALAWLGGSHRELRGRLIFHGISPEMTDEYRFRMYTIMAHWSIPRWVLQKILWLEPGEFWEPDESVRAILVR